MPQLDIVTLFSQVFWLVIIWVSCYLVTTQRLLPPIAKLLKLRQQYCTEIDPTRTTATTAAQRNFCRLLKKGNAPAPAVKAGKPQTAGPAQTLLRAQLAAENLKRL